MIACVDVDYREREVVAACVTLDTWTASAATGEYVVTRDAAPASYEPGEFYRRELPHLLGVLALVPQPLTLVVVDAYVWLGPERPGLGAHLYTALGARTPVAGIAKTAFAGASALEVRRGGSARPLYVTAIGIDAAQVAADVRAMHGEHRIPTVLRRVDHLARGHAR